MSSMPGSAPGPSRLHASDRPHSHTAASRPETAAACGADWQRHPARASRPALPQRPTLDVARHGAATAHTTCVPRGSRNMTCAGHGRAPTRHRPLPRAQAGERDRAAQARRCAWLRSCLRRVSPAYEQQMGDEGRTPLIRPGRPPVISRWRRRACCSLLARCTPRLLS
jgi:hypothetical protein